MRFGIARAGGGLLAAGALAIAGIADAGSQGPVAFASSATGAALVSESLGGDAIVKANGIGPGDSVTGSVTIVNNGDATGAFTLAESGLTDTPGSGGGILSSRLHLEVQEIATGRQVYSGGIGAMDTRSLGYLRPDQSRAYQFTVTFAHGAGDDAFSQSDMTVAFDWSAVTGEPPAEPPAGTQTSEPPRGTPTADTRPPRVTIKSRDPQRLRGRQATITITCDERCFLVGMSREAKPKPRERLLAGVPTRQRVRLSHADQRLIRQRLRRHPHTTLALALTVKDRAGNRATTGFPVRVRR
jgi:hypothetical protein